MVDIAVLDKLVPAGDVVDLLAREHDRRGTYANYQVCQAVALETLIARLKNGQLKAYTTVCVIDSTIDTGAQSESLVLSPWDFFHHNGALTEVPIQFWQHFHYAGDGRRDFDPVTGDFRFEYIDGEFSSREGSAYSVHFDQRGLPAIALPTGLEGAKQETSNQNAVSVPNAAPGKGRPSANWWPDFAEELAVFCLDEGIPEGDGTEGQSEVIDVVFGRMVAAGKAEPSRTTVQKVVNQVLLRWRAGK